jgi:hypothetical protein
MHRRPSTAALPPAGKLAAALSATVSSLVYALGALKAKREAGAA